MESEIQNSLNNPPHFTNEEELKKYILETTRKISQHEKKLVENGSYDTFIPQLFNWKEKLIQLVRNNHRPELQDMTEEETDLFNVVSLASRQVDKADYNIELLSKSGIKLKGLNYSLSDVHSEIEKTKSVLVKQQYEEKQEERYLILGLLVLILACLIILIDKYVL